METLVNCEIVADIRLVWNILGGDQYFIIYFEDSNKTKKKLVFSEVWDMRYSIESGYRERGDNFIRDVREESSMYIIKNSEYLKYFERQAVVPFPMGGIENYIIFDRVDTIVEFLASKKPELVELDKDSFEYHEYFKPLGKAKGRSR